MRARVAACLGIVPMALAACGGASPTTSSSSGTLGCGGWFMVSHHTLAAHVQLLGDVRSIAVNALLDDGTTRGTSTPVMVAAGTTTSTVTVPHVDGLVVSAAARVLGDPSTRQASCQLSNPH